MRELLTASYLPTIYSLSLSLSLSLPLFLSMEESTPSRLGIRMHARVGSLPLSVVY